MGKHHAKRTFPLGPFIVISALAAVPGIASMPTLSGKVPAASPTVGSTGQSVAVAPGAAGNWTATRTPGPHRVRVAVRRSHPVESASAPGWDRSTSRATPVHTPPPRPVVKKTPAVVVAPKAAPKPRPSAWANQTRCWSW